MTRFARGDRMIRQRITELAERHGATGCTVARRAVRCGTDAFVYELEGTERSVALRVKDVESASEPETFARRIEPRLRAMFETIWWQQAVILMTSSDR